MLPVSAFLLFLALKKKSGLGAFSLGIGRNGTPAVSAASPAVRIEGVRVRRVPRGQRSSSSAFARLSRALARKFMGAVLSHSAYKECLRGLV